MRSKKVLAQENPLRLGPVVSDRNDKISEYKRRRPRTLQKRIDALKAIPFIEQEGWQEKRKLPGGRVIIEKTKLHDEVLENRFWCVLYQFGFEELNAGRNFQIQVTSEGHRVEKQIDVFGKDGDIIVVAECK